MSPRRRCRSTTPARSSKAAGALPHLIGPHKEDICYATTNRQLAVKKVAPVVDALIVVGAPNSSNSQRLREVAEREGCPVSRAGAARERSRLEHVRGHHAASASRRAPRRRK
jgi:4-hydroxy-3-methylbut-2-enyl diphosphate reductase IspH